MTKSTVKMELNFGRRDSMRTDHKEVVAVLQFCTGLQFDTGNGRPIQMGG
jgi:hypothetical protein